MPRHHTGRKIRLHKKLRTGPYQQMGFQVAIEATEADSDAFLDKIVQLVEDNGLLYGGSPAGGFIVPAGRESATEAHRQLFEQWLASHPGVRSFSVGPLQDAWHQ